METDAKQKHFIKWLIFTAAIFLLFNIVVFSGSCAYAFYYKDKFYPNTYIAGIDVSGKSLDDVRQIVNEKIDRINQNGIVFSLGNKKTQILPVYADIQGDIAIPIITFDPEKTINDVYYYHRNKNFWTNWPVIFTYFIKSRAGMSYALNEKEVIDSLLVQFDSLTQKAANAKLSYSTDGNGGIYFSVQEEKNGEVINMEKGIEKFKSQLANLDSSEIVLETKREVPEIKKEDCLNIDSKAESLLSQTPLKLINDDKEWLIDKTVFVSWLTLTRSENGSVIVSIDPTGLEGYLSEKVAKEIDQEPIDAKFEMKDGLITEFQASQDGIKLNISSSTQKIISEVESNSTSTIGLIVDVAKSTIGTSEVNEMGIKELIGTGQSNFKGSSKNRIHNIKNGASKLNGVLIEPDEEFSLLKALGKIDKDTGYLQELVIKENKTIPEYGGGLCQIGTTMFRAALNTGLPITQRRNHSYRVSYYEPAGTDATIYDPAPDLRFKNDTGNHILIQTRISGENLYFDFYGTKDGRLVNKTNPTISNIVKPGPTKLIETLDLKPGEKKCTEKAHNGADAFFDYKVTYTTGEVKEKRYSSHYVPWREVCLIGVEKLSTETTATSTPIN